MTKVAVKDLKEGDIVKVTVTAKVNGVRNSVSSLGDMNNTKQLKVLNMTVDKGPLDNIQCRALVEENDKLIVTKRGRRTWGEFFKALITKG